MKIAIHTIKTSCFYFRVSLVFGKNAFEVMYTRVQVQYKAEKIMEFVLVT
jgi:hypothetical protein